MTDPVSRFRLFELLSNLPLPQFEALLFALKSPAGNIPASSAPQAERVRDLLRWAESPVGCGLPTVAALAQTMFGIDVPDFTDREHQPPATEQSMPVPEWKEHLGNGVYLEMVTIPAGRFWMGSPDREEGRSGNEGPIHSVTVPAFALGKYPVTQVQWSEVAALPRVQLELDPFPSYFKGEQRPVEQVSWDQAVEFCQRLARLTNRGYRLPSEAEWEYAGRARTTTPFYFGATISTQQANYSGTASYGAGSKGKDRGQTTEVGLFPANAFGLYDIHGNVWEWCTDHWHDNYAGAPIDGTAWLSDAESTRRVIRGGSWISGPKNSRSAFRYFIVPDFISYNVGFRVCCSISRT